MADLISSQINLSRDAIRQQITSYIQTYLELENVDLTKSSFLSYIINVISTLTGNLMFYQTSTYNEFFLTKAQLPESVFNLSAFLGYNTQEASYATTNVLITVPFGFNASEYGATATFTIPENFIFTAQGEIQFTTYYTVDVTVSNNSSVTILLTILDENKRYYLPSSITDDGFTFALPLRQYKEEIVESQIDSSLEQYQFVTVDVLVDGKVSSMIVEVREPDETTWTTWTEYDSIYLMDETTTGYVSRRTDTGRKLYFGNNLIGIQPTPGSTIKTTTRVTEGVSGNVIAGSILTGERIYTTPAITGVNQIVDYSVTNPSPATNGDDEESIEAIRRNAIAGITTLSRLVSENDYSNIDVVIPTSPLSDKSMAVLKRSDIKINDIQVYSPVLFGGDIVPTRNASLEVPQGTSTISRGYEETISGVDYQTLFEMTLDSLNSSANYFYIMSSIEIIPSLERSYDITPVYDIYTDKLTVTNTGTDALFELHYQSTESDFDQCTCTMQINSTGIEYDMVNDGTANFTYTFSPYTLLPNDNETYYFTIYNPSNEAVAKYFTSFVFRQSLHDFMVSETVSDGTSVIVYDVPVIQKTYYDGIDQSDFELSVLQTMITNMDLSDYRMLTDFTNIKFTNTTGESTNMQNNPTNRAAVASFVTSVPAGPSSGDRYILTEDGSYKNYIIQCTDSTAETWTYIQPATDDIVYVTDEGEKYIYSNDGWVVLPTYTIPLEIEIEIFKESTYSGTDIELTNLVRSTIVTAFSDRFGSNISLYRSEIIDTVQSIDGVDHCRLFQPETNIFFNFNVELYDLTEAELLIYGPEYIYFDEEDITVRIYS